MHKHVWFGCWVFGAAMEGSRWSLAVILRIWSIFQHSSVVFAREWFIITFKSFWKLASHDKKLSFFLMWGHWKSYNPFFQWKYDFQSGTAGRHQLTEKVSASLTLLTTVSQTESREICLSVQLDYTPWIIDEKSNNAGLLSIVALK